MGVVSLCPAHPSSSVSGGRKNHDQRKACLHLFRLEKIPKETMAEKRLTQPYGLQDKLANGIHVESDLHWLHLPRLLRRSQ